MRGEHLEGSVTFQQRERERALAALEKAKQREKELEEKAKNGEIQKITSSDQSSTVISYRTK